jgi:hypothetical protein
MRITTSTIPFDATLIQEASIRSSAAAPQNDPMTTLVCLSSRAILLARQYRRGRHVTQSAMLQVNLVHMFLFVIGAAAALIQIAQR